MKRLLVPLFLATAALGAVPAVAGASTSRAPSTAKYVCLIVLDAGRPDYISKNLGSMPNMRALLAHARWYNKAWVGDLMSITPPGHAVIGTGSFPRNDGGINNWEWGDHQTGKISPTFQALKNFQNGWAFKVIRDSGTPTLSGEIRKKYPKGLVIAGSGAHFHAAGPMGGPDASWIYYFDRINGSWAPATLGSHPVPARILGDPSLRQKLASSNNSTIPLVYDPLPLGHQDSLVVKTAIRAVQLYRPRGIMINLPEVDTAGHWSKSWYPEEARLYTSFDRDLGQLIAAYKQAKIYSKTLFVITADHGIIQSKTRVVDRDAIVNQIQSTLGSKSIILTNGGGAAGPTMTSIWLKNPANDERMARAIFARHYANVSAVYYMTNSGGRYAYKMAGCESCSSDLQKTYDYMLSTEAGPTGEDIAILLRENTRTSGFSQMPGRHGGADWGSQHVTLILSGPGVQNGTSDHPARLADIAPTIERFMGITPNARDGIVLADAFQQPNAADTATQQSSDATMSVYVNALSQRAARDILLEKAGKLANTIPPNERSAPARRRWTVMIGETILLLGTAIGLGWVLAQMRRRDAGLHWDE